MQVRYLWTDDGDKDTWLYNDWTFRPCHCAPTLSGIKLEMHLLFNVLYNLIHLQGYLHFDLLDFKLN